MSKLHQEIMAEFDDLLKDYEIRITSFFPNQDDEDIVKQFISTAFTRIEKEARAKAYQEIKTLMDSWAITPHDDGVAFRAVYKRVRDNLTKERKDK